MHLTGRALSWLGLALFPAAFLWGTSLCVDIAEGQLGAEAGLLALLFAPLSYALVPWYAGFALGQWLPLLVNYGVGMVALPLILLGKALAGDYQRAALREQAEAARVPLVRSSYSAASPHS